MTLVVQKQRDARLLRSILRELPPPRGVTPGAWRRYVATRIQPRVELILQDLGQPVEGPTAKPEDHEPIEREAPRERAAPARRSVTIRETLARTIENAHPVLGDSLDERVDALLLRALVDLGMPVLRSGKA